MVTEYKIHQKPECRLHTFTLSSFKAWQVKKYSISKMSAWVLWTWWSAAENIASSINSQQEVKKYVTQHRRTNKTWPSSINLSHDYYLALQCRDSPNCWKSRATLLHVTGNVLLRGVWMSCLSPAPRLNSFCKEGKTAYRQSHKHF